MADRTPLRALVLETRPSLDTADDAASCSAAEGLDGLGAGAFTDHYVKLRITPPLPPAAHPHLHRARLGRRARSADDRLRAPRRHRSGRTWPVAARPGDELLLLGPGGAYTPDPAADWHLMAGDAAVIPAIAASLTRVPAGVPVQRWSRSKSPRRSSPARDAGRPARDVAARAQRAAGRGRRARLPAWHSSTPSSTARRARCARSGATCWSTAACRARRSRSPATGSATAPRRGGARTWSRFYPARRARRRRGVGGPPARYLRAGPDSRSSLRSHCATTTAWRRRPAVAPLCAGWPARPAEPAWLRPVVRVLPAAASSLARSYRPDPRVKRAVVASRPNGQMPCLSCLPGAERRGAKGRNRCP